MGLGRITFLLAALLGGAGASLPAAAQSFAADYGLLRPHTGGAEPALQWGPVRLAPLLQPPGAGQGGAAGLRLGAGDWFGQLGAGHAEALNSLPGAGLDTLSLGGGYRWADGRSLSLQLSRSRGAGQTPGLGLAVDYDWPRYFIRFSWDSRVEFVPVDRLRLSAGVRF